MKRIMGMISMAFSVVIMMPLIFVFGIIAVLARCLGYTLAVEDPE